MRRALRRTRDHLAALSLALCAAACVLWVRSYYADDWLWWTDGSRHFVGAATERGSFRCYHVTTGGDAGLLYDVPAGFPHVGHRTEQPSFDKAGDQYFVPELEWSLAGAGLTVGRWRSSSRYADVSVPLAAVAALSAALPVRLWWRRRARRARERTGLCPSCGYSLTGNTSGVCPECGTPATPGAT